MKPLRPQDWPQIAPPGGRLFLGSGAACPQALIRSLLAASDRLRDIELVHRLTLGPSPWVEPAARNTFRANTFYLNNALRDAVALGEADYTPCSLGDIPSLFENGLMPLDAALVTVSPPDAHGYCSLGVSVDIIPAALEHARIVVAQINPRLPRTHGESFIHQSKIDYFLEAAEELPEWHPGGDEEAAARIAQYVAQLVEDGSTLQLGHGTIPDALGAALSGHRHLGIHTGTLADGIRKLIQAGVVDNSRKRLDPGLTVTACCLGTRELYDFVHDNPHISFRPTSYTNNPAIIAKHPKMIAVNTAVEVDITGQAAADTAQGRFLGGIGGLIDFVRGAAMSPGGLPIITLPSTSPDGKSSRIVPLLSPGAGVVCGRADIHFVVTEHGIATLRGRSIRERVLELIQIAHPRFRDGLLRHAREHNLIAPYERLTPKPVRAIGGVEFRRIRLKDEDYVLRPLHPSDSRRLQEFFYSHTPETIHNRYGYHLTSMTRDRAHELTGTDQEKHLALGIFEMRGPLQRLHAVGRYYLDDDGHSAEIAFVVRETKRRYGMGRLLFEALADIARRRGLKTLWAVVARENEPMLRLFKDYGATLKQRPDESGCHVTIDLDAQGRTRTAKQPRISAD